MLHVVRFSHGVAQGLLVVLLGSLSVGCSLKAASKGATLSLVLPNSSGRLAQLGGAPVHGIVIPSSWNSGTFACYGINVVGPGIADTGIAPSASQFSNFSALASGTTGCSYRGVVSNTVSLAAPGGSTTIDLQVPAGPSRIIQLVGITDAANCGANFLNPADPVNSAALLIGSVSADLVGDTTVSIPISYNASSPKRVDCLHGSAVTVLPVATRNSQMNGFINNIDAAGMSVTGTCSEVGQVVTLTSGAFTASYTCPAGLSWDITVPAATINTLAPSDGSTVVFTVSTVSPSGLSGTPYNFTLVKDTVAPASPSGIALSGVSTPNHLTNISIQVTGVSSGDTVKLFDSSGCAGTVLGVATSSGTSVTVPATLGADGSYSIYSKVFDPAGNSVCGSGFASYTLDTVAPTISAFSISVAMPSYTGATSSFEALATMNATTSPFTAYCAEETGVGGCLTDPNVWQPYSTLGYATFSAGVSRTVSVDLWLKDAAGNTSQKITSSNSIVYDNSCETFAGDGTLASPFLINTPLQFAECFQYKDMTGTYWKLNQDLDLSAYPMLMSTFYGDLDGDYHTITGLTRSSSSSSGVGLFDSLNDASGIKNLNISGASINCIGSFTGCGILAGNANGAVDIKSVVLEGANSISTTGYIGVGGLVGFADGDARFISNKVQGLTISSTAPVTNGAIGGLVGYYKKAAGGASIGDIERNLVANSQITTSNCKNSTGGLVGMLEASSPSVNIKLDRNSANMTMNCTSTSAQAVGGLIGKIYANYATAHFEILNTKVSSTITNVSSSFYGGLIGMIYGNATTLVDLNAALFAGSLTSASPSTSGTLIGSNYLSTTAINIVDTYWRPLQSNITSMVGSGSAGTLVTNGAGVSGYADSYLVDAASVQYDSTLWEDTTVWFFDGTNLPKLIAVDP